MDILKVEDLQKSYVSPETKENFKAVDGISFCLNEIQIYGILGPNGAGKTTLLNIITGSLPDGITVTEGEVRLNSRLKIGRYNQVSPIIY